VRTIVLALILALATLTSSASAQGPIFAGMQADRAKRLLAARSIVAPMAEQQQKENLQVEYHLGQPTIYHLKPGKKFVQFVGEGNTLQILITDRVESEKPRRYELVLLKRLTASTDIIVQEH
jgi:hypothetical protein